MKPKLISMTPQSLIVGMLPVLAIGLTINGLYHHEWWAGFGVVLFMTSLIICVGFALSAPEDRLKQEVVKVVVQKTDVFFPKGAVAFFLALVGFFGAVWFGLYALMIHQHGTL